ncbi:MAG: glycosyltransferase family 4 protein [Planctomycetota bacterium]
MNILIAWSNISGYASACWKALAARPGVNLQVVAYAPRSSRSGTTAFAEGLVEGLDAVLIDPDDAVAMDRALEQRMDADVAAVSGWIHPSYVRLAKKRHAAGRPTLATLDQPWEGTLKQQVTRLRRGPHFCRMARVVCASTAAEWYAGRLGVPPSRLKRMLYAYDGKTFGAIAETRAGLTAETWPRRFVFAGRLVSVKGIDLLAEAYARYRDQVDDPWTLDVCGMGPEEARLKSVPGVELRGFVSPDALPGVFGESGAFVFPSRYEPWGVALAEAMGAGLPAVCSSAVHAGRDLVRDCDTGLIFQNGDAAGLCRSLRWMHEHAEVLPEMGRRAASIAASFTADRWALRWEATLREVMAEARK